jgi:hypothetical protein
MFRVPWHLFEARQARAHLVVARIDGPVAGDQLSAVQALLRRLVSSQKPAGDYAVAVVREAGRPEVYLAFEDPADALKLAGAVTAGATGAYPGWASQRAFELDSAKLAALEASLPTPKTNPGRAPTDEPQVRGRIRRGSRAPINRDD